jgi:hypothetical protein
MTPRRNPGPLQKAAGDQYDLRPGGRPSLSRYLDCTWRLSPERADARELKLTSTGFRRLRAQLGTSVKELSGRGRYQVWGIL